MADDNLHGSLSQQPMQQMPPSVALFWQQQLQEVVEGPIDFKKPKLPFARIRKIMKADEDVRVSLLKLDCAENPAHILNSHKSITQITFIYFFNSTDDQC